MSTRKANPSDLTRRNNNARKAEIAALRLRLARLEATVRLIVKAIR